MQILILRSTSSHRARRQDQSSDARESALPAPPLHFDLGSIVPEQEAKHKGFDRSLCSIFDVSSQARAVPFSRIGPRMGLDLAASGDDLGSAGLLEISSGDLRRSKLSSTQL